MTEEELRKEIINEVLFAIDWDVEAIYDKDKMTTAIINAFREAGWKPPEEVQELQDTIDWFYERDAGESI